MKKNKAKINPSKRKPGTKKSSGVFSYKHSLPVGIDGLNGQPDPDQQFSDIEEDSDDYSVFSDDKGKAKRDNPVKLSEGLRKIEARILAKQQERKSNKKVKQN